MALNWIASDNKTFENEPLWPFSRTAKDTFASLPQMWFSSDDQVHPSGDDTSSLSTQELKDAFSVWFTYLREKFYIDRLVHALYLPSADSGRKTMQAFAAEECARIAYVNTARVRFPRPAELQSALRMARDQSFEFLTALLSNSGLRFRLCILAHLFESALALSNGVSHVEHPRDLDEEEMAYVIKKMQGVFYELLNDLETKRPLQNFLDSVRDLIVSRAFVVDKDDDGDREEFETHALIKDIFPVLAAIQREFDNLGLERDNKKNTDLRSNAATLWTFIKLSLTEERFVCNPDYMDAAITMFKAIRESLNLENNNGPAKRLLQTLVSTADQLWDGGKETYSCLAMERIYAYFIRRSIQRAPGTSRNTRLGENIGFSNNWDMMQDFQSFVQSIARNISPVPVPGIAWKSEGYEMNLESVVLEFPKFSQRNIQLTSSMIYDAPLGTLVRKWNLKISGMEVVTANVQFFFATTSALFGRITDSGKMSLRIPEDSLQLEFSFTISPPKLPEYLVKVNRQSLDRPMMLRPPVFLRGLSIPPRGDLRGPEERPGVSTVDGRRHKRGSQSVHIQHSGARFPSPPNSATGDSSQTVNIIQSILHPNMSLSKLVDSKGKPPSASSLSLARPGRRLSYANKIDIRALYEEHGPSLSENETANTTSGNGLRRRRPYQRRLRSGHDCITINTCLIEIQRLDVDVVDAKRPLLFAMVKGALINHLRKSIEQTFLEAIEDVVDAANEGVEHVSNFTEEDFEKRHGSLPSPPVQKPTRFSWNGDQESSIYAAYPIL